MDQTNGSHFFWAIEAAGVAPVSSTTGVPGVGLAGASSFGGGGGVADLPLAFCLAGHLPRIGNGATSLHGLLILTQDSPSSDKWYSQAKAPSS